MSNVTVLFGAYVHQCTCKQILKMFKHGKYINMYIYIMQTNCVKNNMLQLALVPAARLSPTCCILNTLSNGP